MPNFNLLILPILGAFYFIEQSNFYKVKYSLLDRQRYIYTSFLFAFYLIIPAFFISSVIEFLFPEFSYFILTSIPVKERFIETGLLSFLLGVALSHLFNLLWSKEKIMKKVIFKYGGEVERLTLDCFLNQDLLMISLKNNKVYIGFVSELEFSLDSEFIKIDPVFSGYRDDTKKLNITTDYLEAFEIFDSYDQKECDIDNLPPRDDPMNFTKLLLNKEEVYALSKFHLGLYFAFNEINQKAIPEDSIRNES